MPNIEAQEQAGITFDGTLLVSGRDEQPAYTPRVQFLKNGDNYVYNGSERRGDDPHDEGSRIAQGVDMDSVVFNCSLACYTKDLARAGWRHRERHLRVDAVPPVRGSRHQRRARQPTSTPSARTRPTSFGAQAWQAAIAFQQAVNQIVADQGPNAITRANLTAAFAAIEDFTADGWAGGRSLDGVSPCFVAPAGAGRRVRPGVAGGAGHARLRALQPRRVRSGPRRRSGSARLIMSRKAQKQT